MNGTPAARSRSSAATVFASCMSASVPSCIRAPPDADTTISGTRLGEGVLGGAGDLLADDRAHRAAHEPEVHHADRDRPALDRARPPDRRVLHPGRQLGGGDPVGVGLLVDEPERVDRLEPGVALDERAVVEQVGEPGLGREPEVVAARRADALDLVELLVEQHLLAGRALRPEVGRVGVAAGAERRQLDRHVSRASAVARGGRRSRRASRTARGGADHRAGAAAGRAAAPGHVRGRAGDRDRGGRQRAADQQRAGQLAALVVGVGQRIEAVGRAARVARAAARNVTTPPPAPAPTAAGRRIGGGRLGEADREPLLEPERRMDADQVAAEPVGRPAERRIEVGVGRAAVRRRARARTRSR